MHADWGLNAGQRAALFVAYLVAGKDEFNSSAQNPTLSTALVLPIWHGGGSCAKKPPHKGYNTRAANLLLAKPPRSWWSGNEAVRVSVRVSVRALPKGQGSHRLQGGVGLGSDGL